MSATGAAEEGVEPGRLRWRCRRGMRELDVLMVRYLERDYPQASSAEKAAFRALLELPDPELFGYLVGREPLSDPVWQHVLDRIRAVD